jgi:hypothetical protein
MWASFWLRDPEASNQGKTHGIDSIGAGTNFMKKNRFALSGIEY